MELAIQTSDNKKAGTMNVADHVFSAEFNEPLMHQVLTAYHAGARSGSATQKNRADVRGGGRKPWRQKGTGRARAGTIRSPLWRGGGVTFAAKPRDYSKKVNKKMYRAALRSILSELVRKQRLICVDEFDMAESKTKHALQKLANFNLDNVLIVTEQISDNLYLSVRNIPKVAVIDTQEINPDVLIRFQNVLVTQSAVAKIEAWLA